MHKQLLKEIYKNMLNSFQKLNGYIDVALTIVNMIYD